MGECLNDEPKESPFKFNEVLPGTVYDANYQCGLLYPNSTLCTANGEKMCDKLFCEVVVNGKKRCRSNGEPPVDGTKCAHDKVKFKFDFLFKQNFNFIFFLFSGAIRKSASE